MHAALYYTFLVFFVSHIPITLLIDLQAVFGVYYPSTLQHVVVWYNKTFAGTL
jgi:hypothetical protein